VLTKELKDGYRVIVIDRPDCGWSERDGAEQATLPEQAQMITEFIEIEGWGGLWLWVFFGWDDCRMSGVEPSEPGWVGALALLCPATSNVDKVPDAFKRIDVPFPKLVPVIGNTIAGAMSLLMEKKVFVEVFKPEPITDQFLERGGEILSRRPGSFVAAAQDLAQSRASAKMCWAVRRSLACRLGCFWGPMAIFWIRRSMGRPLQRKPVQSMLSLRDAGI